MTLTPERLEELEMLRAKWHTPPDSTRIGRALDDLLRERKRLTIEVARLTVENDRLTMKNAQYMRQLDDRWTGVVTLVNRALGRRREDA
jgi:hypothetical protein